MKSKGMPKLSRHDLEALNSLIIALRDVELKVKRVIRDLRNKERYYLELYKVAYEQEKDELKATVYACHIAGVRAALKLTYRIEAYVLQLKVMLISCREFIMAWQYIGPSIPVVRERAKKVREFMPWVANYVEELQRQVNEMLEKLSMADISELAVDSLMERFRSINEASSPVIEELEKALEADLSKELPSPPSGREVSRSSLPEPVAISLEGPNYEDAERKDVEDLVYKYICDRLREGGKLNLARCAKELGLPEEDVREALRKLEAKGMIKVRGW